MYGDMFKIFFIITLQNKTDKILLTEIEVEHLSDQQRQNFRPDNRGQSQNRQHGNDNRRGNYRSLECSPCLVFLLFHRSSGLLQSTWVLKSISKGIGLPLPSTQR